MAAHPDKLFDVVQVFDQNYSWAPPFAGFPDTSNWEETIEFTRPIRILFWPERL